MDVASPLVRETSRILVTPTKEIILTLSVVSKVDGEKFTVSTPTPVPEDIPFV